ncbi:MAG: amino acid ABC transporter substrate-binding protein [Rhodocyclales bacterium]|nr:amino acid ABC transporter substrate-binding protein [Rhodocyclales bacterium]
MNALRRAGALALLLSIAIAGAARAEPVLDRVAKSGVVNIGYRDSSPPFSYLDADRRPIGYSIDICLNIVEAMRQSLRRPLEVRYVPVTSATRMDAVIKGEVDLECGTTTSTGERRQKVAFTVPTYIATTRLLVKADSGIASINDLAGKTVVTTRGTTAEKLFREADTRRTLRARLVEAKDHAESFAVLQSGQADAFIMDDVLLYSLRAASGTPERFAVTREPLNIEPLAIMFAKDDAALKQLVDREVVRLIVGNDIHRIYRRWFESPIPPKGINLGLTMSYLLRDSFKAPTDWLPN